MALIDKNLTPSLKLINSFLKMKKVKIKGIQFIENRDVYISKLTNSYILKFETQNSDHLAVESVLYNNLETYSLSHRKRSYIIPSEMSRITSFGDPLLTDSNFQVEINLNSIYSSKLDLDKKYFFRYIVPLDKKENFEDFENYYIKINGIQKGNLIKIDSENNKVHFYQFQHNNRYYLVTESLYKCSFNEIENLAHSTLLTLGFFSGKFHLNETYIVASNRDNFNSPVGLYYKSLRESISGQYSIFTTNAYSVLVPISKKMKAKNAENRMMNIIEQKWKFRIQMIKEDVFNNMVNLFYQNESFARAALLLLSNSKLGLELQSGAFCIAFETICNSINKKYNLVAPKMIETLQWNTIKKDLLAIFNNSKLSKEAKQFGINKINNLNQSTNKDKLTLPFKEIGYELNLNEIKVINDRNLFLHGNLNVKDGENEIDKLFYTSIMLHRLCCTLILKMCSFEGHIINNIALYSSNINTETNEWGFKEI
ncbi:hypothetical protein [Chryseobacterium sp. POE27]|uniref:hypothetical protein n=1 Tax=Chryseobacterium sp. POE27 TaxID=3138177 RepID=UPI00321AED70